MTEKRQRSRISFTIVSVEMRQTKLTGQTYFTLVLRKRNGRKVVGYLLPSIHWETLSQLFHKRLSRKTGSWTLVEKDLKRLIGKTVIGRTVKRTFDGRTTEAVREILA